MSSSETLGGYKSFVRPLNLTNFEDSNPHVPAPQQFGQGQDQPQDQATRVVSS